ncbi:Na+/H+ antiporter subunit C [Corallococcus sp. 4LFB]|uniref:Na+/H+ antiporter subunit C n=1 Tax=Corallococcus sp. 4LFB TaxID=3383249 RepID=UPI0039757C26
MSLLLALVIGCLYAAGTYLVLRRNLMRLILGLALLSHAANLLIFTAAGLRRGRPPIVPRGALTPEAPTAEPLAQALVLTAIVISFGLLAFTVTLLHRAHQLSRSADLDMLEGTDR